MPLIGGKGVYFVGGASGSGKSVATKQMAAEYQLPRMELDEIFRVLSCISEEEIRRKTMKALSVALVSQLAASHASIIVEGGWIWPDTAAELIQVSGKSLRAVFCGYPDDTVERRLDMIKSDTTREPKHWLATCDQSRATKWIEGQIQGSKDYREAAERWKLPFVDFTDVKAGNEALFKDFRTWVS